MATFTDLNSDILLHIVSFINPTPPPPSPHWNNTPQHLSNALPDVRAFRSTCRATLALPIVPSWLVITHWDPERVASEMHKWAHAPSSYLRYVKYAPAAITNITRGITVFPVSDNHTWEPSEARAVFTDFITLLDRAPNLATVQLSNHFLCTHGSFGYGRNGAEWRLPMPPKLNCAYVTNPLRNLSISLKCQFCSLWLPLVLRERMGKLKALRYAGTFPPGLDEAGMAVQFTLNGALHLKTHSTWPIGIMLEALSTTSPGLLELYLSPYDNSRKIQVETEISDVLKHVGKWQQLHSMDLCLSSPESEEEQETQARALVAACPSLRRGWWWTQIGDLDYNQLQGYYRQAWWVENGEVVLGEPRFLAPLVVRNEDAQGRSSAAPSELWH